jgi:gamma-glutamyltranspeptidase/glutathione hydrolase
VDERLAESVRDDSSRLALFPASASLFLPQGKPLAVGSHWRNPDLANTLRRISAQGPAGFYEGETAALITDEMKRGGGLVTAEDLTLYRAVWRTPVEFDYRGFRVISMPPPSSGGVTLAMIAGIARRFDLPDLEWHSAEHIHIIAEAMRRAFADRNHYLGDPDFVPIPVPTLVSDTYGARRAKEIDLTRATPSSRIAHGPGIQEGMHTTHFSVADGAGNVVAMTTTINLGFGSAVTVTGGGFLLNNEMDDFAAKPGSPNVFGLVQGEANAIQPGKRVLSSMTPTVILDRAGKPLLVTGAAGGPRIITSVFQVLSNVADFGMDIDAAVAAPRFHHQHLPDHLLIEAGGYEADVRGELEAMGHTVRTVHGLAVSPSLLRKGEVWHGRSDPRIQGGAAGY